MDRKDVIRRRLPQRQQWVLFAWEARKATMPSSQRAFDQVFEEAVDCLGKPVTPARNEPSRSIQPLTLGRQRLDNRTEVIALRPEQRRGVVAASSQEDHLHQQL